MPGIAKLNDNEYLSAFKHMDGIIQNNQPIFILVWGGSILSVIATSALGIMNLDGAQVYLLAAASVLYLVGVQVPTFRFNIPLNNSLQNMNLEELEANEAATFRVHFETSWNRWNRIRTVNAIFAVSMLLLLLLGL